MLFRTLARQVIRNGDLEVVGADGAVGRYGDGGPPYVRIRLTHPALEWRLAANPSLSVPEAYINGELRIEEGTLRDFLEIAARNFSVLESHPWMRFARILMRQTPGLRQYNPLSRARRNVAHHYDLSRELYRLFLDEDLQYSCAYFRTKDSSLDSAQYDKKVHIASKLLLDRPGLKVLDIGSGWGGLGLYLAEAADCEVTGVTLSVEQHQVSEQRAAERGLSGRVRFLLQDYREESGRYDRIVSVGMFEHVGKRNYDEFFAKLGELLSDDGVCLLHSIGRYDGPAPVNPFIRKYIFPGADLPALSEVMSAMEQSGLFATDIEILRLHYAETLKAWQERFRRNRAKIAALYDERFCRMWELYLAGCEMGFRHQNLMVFQLQISKKLTTVPLTRDYMFDWERRQLADQVRAAE